MRRPGVVALLVTACAGLLGLALLAATDERELAFTIGVVPTTVAADLRPGATACQAPIAVPEDFSRLSVRAGGAGPGQPLDVSVLDTESGRRLGHGRAPGGYADATDQTVSVGRVETDRTIGVCIRNAGTRRASLYGNAAAAAPLSAGLMGRRQLDTDVSLVFLKGDSRSMLSQLPDVFERASVFRPGWVGPWLFWVLAAGVLLGVPVLLAGALAATAEPAASEAPEARVPERASAP